MFEQIPCFPCLENFPDFQNFLFSLRRGNLDILLKYLLSHNNKHNYDKKFIPLLGWPLIKIQGGHIPAEIKFRVTNFSPAFFFSHKINR